MPPTSLSGICDALCKTFENDTHAIFDIGMMAPQGPSYVARKTNEYVQKRMDAEAFDEVVFVGESWGADIGIMVSEHLAHSSIVIAGEPSEAGFHSEDEVWRARMHEQWLRFGPHLKKMGPIAMKAMDSSWGWLGPQETWKRINNLHTLEKRAIIIAGFGGQQPSIETTLKSNDFYALRAKSNFQCFNFSGGGHRVLNREAAKIAGLTLAILNPSGNAQPDNPGL